MATHDYNLANASGAAFRADLNNALAAIVSQNSGAVAPATTFAFMPWYDTANRQLKIRDATNTFWILVMEFPSAALQFPFSRSVPLDIAEQQLALNDATPDVSGGIHFVTNSGVPTTITNFVGSPAAGWLFVLRAADANTTIAGSLTHTGRAIPLLVDDYLILEYDGAVWNQVGGSVGMGRIVLVDPPDGIGDWIGNGVVAFTDVDVSDDSVRKGANAVILGFRFDQTVGNECVLFLRENGSASSRIAVRSGSGGIEFVAEEVTVGLDDDAKFEARFNLAWVSAGNNAEVIGYHI